MRICIVDTFRDHNPASGGHAIRVFNIAQWLSQQGHSVLIIRPSERATSIEGHEPRILSVGAGGRFARFLRAFQVRFFPRMRHFEDSVLMNTPRTLSTLRTHIKSADLVQLEDPTLLGPLLVAKLYRKVIIADTDGISSEVAREMVNLASPRVQPLLAYTVILLCEKLWFRLSSKVVTSSPGDKQMVSLLHHINQEKIVVVPNPFDASIRASKPMAGASIRRALGLSAETPVAVFVGDLRAQHNLEAVDYIARMVTNFQSFREHNVRIMIVGQFDRMPKEWKIPDLIFTGPVRDLAAYVSASDVCIAPLFSQPSGIKTKVLTYLALGKPTIATPMALIGLDASVRKYVLECTAADFPAVLLGKLTRDSNSAPNDALSATVQSLYGVDAVGRTYSREVLASIHVKAERA